jgi:hypothetical protein
MHCARFLEIQYVIFLIQSYSLLERVLLAIQIIVFLDLWLSSGFGRRSGLLIPNSQMLKNLFYLPAIANDP